MALYAATHITLKKKKKDILIRHLQQKLLLNKLNVQHSQQNLLSTPIQSALVLKPPRQHRFLYGLHTMPTTCHVMSPHQ